MTLGMSRSRKHAEVNKSRKSRCSFNRVSKFIYFSRRGRLEIAPGPYVNQSRPTQGHQLPALLIVTVSSKNEKKRALKRKKEGD
jgi:ABC-type glycerol-3-phosphate transport system substrate-binding protein